MPHNEIISLFLFYNLDWYNARITWQYSSLYIGQIHHQKMRPGKMHIGPKPTFLFVDLRDKIKVRDGCYG